MLPKLLTSIFGSRNERLLKQYRRVVDKITALEPQYEKLDDAALRAKTDEFRQRIAQGATLDDLLPEAFAVVREAGKRVFKIVRDLSDDLRFADATCAPDMQRHTFTDQRMKRLVKLGWLQLGLWWQWTCSTRTGNHA